MASLERKNFETEADEVSAPNNARVEPVNVLGQRVMKLTVQPGWTITCKHNDGGEITYSAGDAYAIEPGHDAWVVGDMPAVAYEFHGAWGENH